MKLIKIIVIVLLSYFLCSCEESTEKHWQNFNDEVWSAKIVRLDKDLKILDVVTNTFLYLQTDSIIVKYAIVKKSDHPDLLKAYKAEYPCMTDLLSGMHGQVKCHFAFKDHFYFHIYDILNSTECNNLSPESKNDCIRLAFAMKEYIQ